MARGKTLGALETKLRSVLGHERSPAAGGAFSDHYKEALRFAQEELYDEYSWPFLDCVRDKNIGAGQRYYDFPTDLPLENVERVKALWNDQYYDIAYGITEEDYNQYNSDSGDRADPIEKWRVINTGSIQFEVWPLPATSQTGGIRFWGKKALGALVDTNDVADLDDILICYRAAFNLTTDEKRAAKFKAMERDRMRVLTGRAANLAGSEPVIIGGAAQPKPWRGTVIRIAGT